MANSLVPDSELIRIRNELALKNKKNKTVYAWQIRDVIATTLSIDLHVSTIRGRFVMMGQPLSNGGMAKVENPTPLSAVQPVTKKNYTINPELEQYVPKDEEFIGYVERGIDHRLNIHYRAGKYPLSQGPQGCGKTYGHMHFAWKNKLPFFLFSCYEDFNLVQLFGDRTIQNGSIVFQESLFVKAIQGPCVILFDEINALSNAGTYDFYAFLQNRSLYIKDALDGKGKVFNLHPDCYVGFAQNPKSAKYIGGNIKSSAFLGRCTFLTYPDFNRKEITTVIRKKFPTLDGSEIDEFVRFFMACKDTITNNAMPVDISIRQLINIIDLWMHGMKLDLALEDGMIGIFDSISQPKAKESFNTLAEGTWKTLMDIKKAQMKAKVQQPKPTTTIPNKPTTTIPNKPTNKPTTTIPNKPTTITHLVDCTGCILQINDVVKAKGMTGVIRHIGLLNGSGSATTVWSEWNGSWDGEIKTVMDGGTLKRIESQKTRKTGHQNLNSNAV